MGEFLTIGYFFRTMGYCFPIVFWKFLWEDKALMEGDKVVMGIPSPPTRENHAILGHFNKFGPLRNFIRFAQFWNLGHLEVLTKQIEGFFEKITILHLNITIQ